MKKRHIILAMLAIALVLCSTIGTSLAYFTTYAAAKGGYIIKASPTIDEPLSENTKHIRIINQVGASPVYVRVKVFSGSEYEIVYTLGTNWSRTNYNGEEDGYFYYTVPLMGEDPTNATSVLDAKIDKIPERLKDSEEFNIVVVYESVLAVFDGDTPNFTTSWKNGTVTRITE